MAYSKVLTTVANPATGKRKKKNMAKRKLSAKQIKFFGSARQRAALKAKRKRHAPAKKRRVSAKRKPNPAPKRRAARAVKRAVRRKKRTVARRKNVGEILVLTAGNPAKKGKRTMAKKRYTKKKRASVKRSNPAGRRRTTKKSYSRKMRRNPGMLGGPKDWVKGGLGVIAGGVGTRLLPQLALPSMNNGPTGYALNAGAALLLAWGAHVATKDKVITAAVAAGGFAGLILRIVNDQTPYGRALSLSGMGDYMVSNWTQPQRITDPRGAMFEMGGQAAAMVAARNGEDGSGNC